MPKTRGNRNVQHWPMRRYPLDFELRKMRESRYLGNGTSDHGNKKWRPLLNTKYPQKPGITHLRNHFWPIESVFWPLLCTKTAFSNAPNSRILKFWILAMLILYYGAAITDREANFVELGHVETYSGY